MHAAQRPRFFLLPTWSVNAARRGVYGLYGLSSEVYNKLDTAFILGHMRSGSSLLTKLLSTSPEVIEHGELNLVYSSRLDLTVMKGRVLWGKRQVVAKPPQRVAVDKLLTDWLLPLDRLDLVVEHDVKPIFLLRSPEASVKSMVRTFSFMSLPTSVKYYKARVQMLERYATEWSGRLPMVALDYDDIVHRTTGVFRLIEDHLDLQTPLSEDFSSNVEAPRGRRRGDPSANLSKGVILTETAAPSVKVEIADADLQRMTAIYDQCRAVLSETCRTPVEEDHG